MKKDFGTLSQTIEGLNKEGYTMDFNISQECLACQKTNITLSPDEFQIDAFYRFEGESNPDDEAVVYAISSAKYGVKGILVMHSVFMPTMCPIRWYKSFMYTMKLKKIITEPNQLSEANTFCNFHKITTSHFCFPGR